MERSAWIADPLHIRKMVVVKVGFRPFGRPEMDKYGPNPFGLNQVTDPVDVVQKSQQREEQR